MGRGRGWVVGVLAVAGGVLAGLLSTGAEEGPGEAACPGLTVGGLRQEPSLTAEFARYGDDGARADDWTGGDGTRSVRLPDGRTLWLSQDTFLDRTSGPTRQTNPAWVRNSALVQESSGRLTRTLLGGTPGRPAALFGGTATADGREVWRWPVHGVVEPRTPGAREQVVRVVLWRREAGPPPWNFGLPQATEVATLSLPDLRLEGIETVSTPDAPPGRRALYGTSAVAHDGWSYVFGADERGVRDGRASRAYLARAPRGQLDRGNAWRYWDGRGWARPASAARPLDVGHPAPDGSVTNSYGVARHRGHWLLVTMDAGGPDGRPSPTLVAYWACAPTGPWHGPHEAGVPPLPDVAAQAGAAAYNPQPHPAAGGDGLLLGHDVNVLADPSAVHRDTALYRPRFLRLDLRPAKGSVGGGR